MIDYTRNPSWAWLTALPLVLGHESGVNATMGLRRNRGEDSLVTTGLSIRNRPCTENPAPRPYQVVDRFRRLGEKQTDRKNIAVARRTMAGPDGRSQR